MTATKAKTKRWPSECTSFKTYAAKQRSYSTGSTTVFSCLVHTALNVSMSHPNPKAYNAPPPPDEPSGRDDDAERSRAPRKAAAPVEGECRHGNSSRRRPEYPSDPAHIRRLQGAMVHDHRRPALIRGACGGLFHIDFFTRRNLPRAMAKKSTTVMQLVPWPISPPAATVTRSEHAADRRRRSAWPMCR
jgi:hypothetical protein